MALRTSILTILRSKVKYFITRASHTDIIHSKWSINWTQSNSSFRVGLWNIKVSLEKLIRLIKNNVFSFRIWDVNDYKTFLLSWNIFFVLFTIFTGFSWRIEIGGYIWTLLIGEGILLASLTLGNKCTISLILWYICIVLYHSVLYSVVLMKVCILCQWNRLNNKGFIWSRSGIIGILI